MEWNKMIRKFKLRLMKWYWWDAAQEWNLRLTWFGRTKATVWNNGVWHTWDDNGFGGENSEEKSVENAKISAFNALIRQQWI